MLYMLEASVWMTHHITSIMRYHFRHSCTRALSCSLHCSIYCHSESADLLMAIRRLSIIFRGRVGSHVISTTQLLWCLRTRVHFDMFLLQLVAGGFRTRCTPWVITAICGRDASVNFEYIVKYYDVVHTRRQTLCDGYFCRANLPNHQISKTSIYNVLNTFGKVCSAMSAESHTDSKEGMFAINTSAEIWLMYYLCFWCAY